MPPFRRAASLTFLLASLSSRVATGQGAPGTPVAIGTFAGKDSLDARKEPATPSRVRQDLHGSANWTIEMDSLDLRQKFTLRIELPEPSPITIVLRSLDSLPPRPGPYTVMIPSTGASHSDPATVHGDVYTRERDTGRHYLASGSRIQITSVSMADGQPVVTGSVEMRSFRYADAPRGALVFDYVWFNISGAFAARATPNARPRAVVTAEMQEAVLRRALDGFVITHSGAINGDGNADSTWQPGPARQFLESRWRDAAIVERAEATRTRYAVRLRGRYAPVTCEVESATEEIDCVTLPVPVVAAAGAAPGAVAGRLATQLAGATPTTRVARTVYLLPNPLPRKEAFRTWCDEQDKRDSVAEQAFTAKLESMKDTAAQRKAIEGFVNTAIQSFRQSYESLLASYSIQRTAVAADGQYAFHRVPAGNYLLFTTLMGEERYFDWYVPIAINSGQHINRDLDNSTVSSTGFTCGMPFPFPVVNKAGRTSSR